MSIEILHPQKTSKIPNSTHFVVSKPVKKTVSECNHIFECKINDSTLWGKFGPRSGTALAGLASTNTGHFRVCGSRCGQQLETARFRKECNKSRGTDSVQEYSRPEWFVNLGGGGDSSENEFSWTLNLRELVIDHTSP